MGQRAANPSAGVSGWTLVWVLAITETVSWGVLYYAFPVLLVPMRSDLGWSTAELTAGFSLALIVSALAGVPVGRWLDRHAPRALLTAGSLLGALMVAAWSQVESLVAFYLVFSGIGVAMAIVLYQSAFTVLTKWFAPRRHDALTALTLVAATASLIFSPLTNHLAEHGDWRKAALGLAGLLAVVTIPLHALLPHRPPPRNGESSREISGRRVLRSSGFWLFTTAFGLEMVATTAATVLFIPVLIERGHEAAFAALAAGLIGISALPGRALFGLALRHLGPRTVLTGVFGGTSLSIALLLAAQARGAVLAAAVVLGATNGMATLAFATGIGDRYGTGSYGLIGGLSSFFLTTARAAAPVSAAALPVALAADSLEPGLWMAATASLLAVAAGLASVEAERSSARERGDSGEPIMRGT